jgi:hypothetical protein
MAPVTNTPDGIIILLPNANSQPSTANRYRSSNHYPITVIWQLKPLDTHFPIPDNETEDSFILLRAPG